MRRALVSALALLTAFLLLFPACRRKEQEPGDAAVDIETAAPPEETAPPASPDPTEAPAPVNPAASMFTDFFEAFSMVSDGLFEAVEGMDRASDAYFSLMMDEELLSRLYPTVGALGYDGTGGFSGHVSGSYAGNGTLYRDGAFYYSFLSGARFEGSVSGDESLTASFINGEELVSLRLIRLVNGFLFFVSDWKETRVCELRGGSLKYGFVDSQHIFALSDAGFPDIDGIPALSYLNGTASFSE